MTVKITLEHGLKRPNWGRGECKSGVGHRKWFKAPVVLLSFVLVQYAPVSGTIEEVNEALASQPGLLNKSPEDKGLYIVPGVFSSYNVTVRLVVQDKTFDTSGGTPFQSCLPLRLP